MDKDIYLKATKYIDSDNSAIALFTKEVIHTEDTKTKQVIDLYYAIRDTFWYDPYNVDISERAFTASTQLKNQSGNCIEKANLMVACCRHIRVASRLCLADVVNHIGTEKLEEYLKTNVLVCHGYVEVFLEEKWVKCTPAFNKELCEKLNVLPLEFDGKTDSIFQEYDKNGGQFMKYVKDRGYFEDVPRDYIINEFKIAYPHMFEKMTDYNKPFENFLPNE